MSDTIIGASYEPPARLQPLVMEGFQETTRSDTEAKQRLFKIRAADSEGRRSSARILVSRMYAWRGYATSTAAPTVALDAHNRITLLAEDHDETIGTMTIGFDGPDKLFVDQLFPEEVEALRRDGHTLCEFTKLAMDSVVRSKRVLASLFHVAYMYAHRLLECDSLMIEVNPRHVRYYEKMLGFQRVGPERLNPRVNAPAVLMRLNFAHAHSQIMLFGGQSQLSAVERSLYPYFFSIHEEAGIVSRLQGESARLRAPLKPGYASIRDLV